VLLRQDGRGHLGFRQARGGGHVGQLAGGLGQRPAVPLHEHAPGDRYQHRGIGVGGSLSELAPLAFDHRRQQRRVPDLCHRHHLRHG
jgi:hypothetical protein